MDPFWGRTGPVFETETGPREGKDRGREDLAGNGGAQNFLFWKADGKGKEAVRPSFETAGAENSARRAFRRRKILGFFPKSLHKAGKAVL